MRRIALTVIFIGLFVVSACAKQEAPSVTASAEPTTTPSPIKPTTPTIRCQETVAEMEALTQGLRIPDHLHQENPEKTGEEFDVNVYFNVLTHLSPEPGYVLDYVYRQDPLGSRPVIYARREEESPYKTYVKLYKAVDDPFGKYLEHIQVDGTAQGFFEWVVLRTYGEQFYLTDNAIPLLDWTILCNREAAEAAIDRANEFGNPLTAEQKQKALQLDFEPRVELEEETVQVRIMIFSKWGGFFEHVETISREFPHQLLEYENEELVPYNCGVMP